MRIGLKKGERKWLSRTALLMAFAVIVAACGGTGGETTTTVTSLAPTTTQTSGPTETTIGEATLPECETYDEITLANYSAMKVPFSPAPVAIELGFFRDFCINVTYELVGSGNNAMQAVQTNEAHVAIATIPPTAAAIIAGSPLTAIWGTVPKYMHVVSAIEGINSCSDLEGKTVATAGIGTLEHSVMQIFLETCGLDIDTDVELFFGQPSAVLPLLASGQIQAGMQHADDKATAEQDFGVKFNQLAVTPDFADIAFFALIAQQAEVDANPDLYARIVAAMMVTSRWLHTDSGNLDEYLAVMAKLASSVQYNQPSRGSALVVTAGYEVIGPTFPKNCEEAFPTEAYEWSINKEVEFGNIPHPLPQDELVSWDVCRAGEALADLHPNSKQ